MDLSFGLVFAGIFCKLLPMTAIDRLRLKYLEKRSKDMKWDIRDLKARMKKLELQVRGERSSCGRPYDPEKLDKRA